jgi:predicted S18 family serine protease
MSKFTVKKCFLIASMAGAFGVAGCSSVQPPTAAMSQAQLAIREADQSKASQYAPLELRQAREKFAEAEKAMRNEEYLTARRLAEQALVDARLAETKANSQIARQNAAELQKAIESLRAEAERGSR